MATTVALNVPTISGMKLYLGRSEIGCQTNAGFPSGDCPLRVKNSSKLAVCRTRSFVNTGSALRPTKRKMRMIEMMATIAVIMIVFSATHSTHRLRRAVVSLFIEAVDRAIYLC